MRRFPVLISIPHGGDQIPVEIADRVCLSKKEIFDDIDPFTRDIYDLGGKVVKVIKANIARTFVDLNRALVNKPLQNPDGVLKTQTCYQKQVFYKGQEPDERLEQSLLNRYYEPYHKKIRNAIKNKNIELALDCHSMAAIGPPISPDTGVKRPLICLGNRFGESCDWDIIEKLANCFCNAFSLKESEVTINRPFAGGFITSQYGNNPIPWVQIEISRALYLTFPYFDSNSLKINQSQLEELKKKFEMALNLYFNSSNN